MKSKESILEKHRTMSLEIASHTVMSNMGGRRISCTDVYKGNRRQFSRFEILEIHVETRSHTVLGFCQ